MEQRRRRPLDWSGAQGSGWSDSGIAELPPPFLRVVPRENANAQIFLYLNYVFYENRLKSNFHLN